MATPTKKYLQETHASAAELASAWRAVCSTLRITLAGRALGDALFPSVAINDRFAAATLQAIGDDGTRWVTDRHSMWGVLARTRFFRDQAQSFMRAHPDAHFVNIGCGLSQYFQWLDNGQTRMTDADLLEVVAVREQLLPPLNARHRVLAVDVTRPDWWEQLQLPHGGEQPLFLMMEGVSMYLDADQMRSVLRVVGEQAPEDSFMVLDAFCMAATGNAIWHPSLRQTGASLRWGLKRLSEFREAHERLHLVQTHDIMAGYGVPNALVSMGFTLLTGVPFYAAYVLRVAE